MGIIKVKGAVNEAVLIQELHAEVLAPFHLRQFLLPLLADVVELGLPLELVALSAMTIRVSVCAVIIRWMRPLVLSLIFSPFPKCG